VIQSAPTEVDYGQQFTVSAGGGATSAVLMAPGATTHAFDMQQRSVPLEVQGADGGTLALRSPDGGTIAPPGYYMLFVLNADGVPSVARWVRLGIPTAPESKKRAPKVSVKLLRPRGASGPLRALVKSDMASTVRLKIKLKVGGRGAGGRRVQVSFKAAGGRRIAIPLKADRVSGSVLRAGVTVAAEDSDGNRSRWKRTLRLVL
jgi:hypothetical protein